MSNFGRLPIFLPTGVKVLLSVGSVTVVGVLGDVTLGTPRGLHVSVLDEKVVVTQTAGSTEKASTRMWGTFRSNLRSAIIGVTFGHVRKLKLIGLGYRSTITTPQKSRVLGQQQLELAIGYCNIVKYSLPNEVAISLPAKDLLIFSGIRKQSVSQVAEKVHRLKPPEPYKGKGIQYLNEKVRRKEGKKQ